MLHTVVFYSSYLFILCILIQLSLRKHADPTSILFLIGVSLIPIGKLFYMPVPGLSSVGMAFVYTSLLSIAAMTLALIRGIPRSVFLPLAFAVPPLVSLVFLSATSQEWFLIPNLATGTAETGLLRIVSIILVTLFSTYCAFFVLENETARRDVAVYYIVATLFATAIGVLIFHGVFIGVFTVDNLQPISRDVHIIGRIYRFNPGANVNEFGQIIGYALLLLRWTGWSKWRKTLIIGVLLIADFLSLTRGAWLALVAGYFVLFLFSSARVRMMLFFAGLSGMAMIVIVASSWDILTPLLQSRTQLSGGVSGEDRLNSYFAALIDLQEHPFRLLFGFGWAADLYGKFQGLGTDYIHNVPLMIIFDTGIVGFLIYFLLLVVYFRIVFTQTVQDLAIPLSLMAFMFTLSLMHHNFYHVQTWLIFGLVLGDALRARIRTLPASPRTTLTLPSAQPGLLVN